MRYGIIGSGAVGGYYGGKLAKSGQEVHFLFRSDYVYVASHGLQINSCNGSFHLDRVNAYSRTADMPPCDVVLVCLKSVNNYRLKDLLPPLLRDNTLVILIQNGIGVEEDVQRDFPGVQLCAGIAFICSAKTEHGCVNHQCFGHINLANYSCRDEALVQAVAGEFRQAGIETALVEYHEARWKKAVWNMPFNGMTVTLHTQTDLLLKNPVTRQLVRDMMMEVVGAARQLGVKGVDEAHVEKMIEMTDGMMPYSPSMRLDYDFHRKMEIYYIYTRPIEMAREAGFRMPKLEMLEAELRFLSFS